MDLVIEAVLVDVDVDLLRPHNSIASSAGFISAAVAIATCS